MVQITRPYLRPAPLRRGLAEVARALGLAGVVGIAVYLAVQKLPVGGNAGLQSSWGRTDNGTSADAPVAPAVFKNESGDMFETVTLAGGTFLNEAAQAFLFPSVLSPERQVVVRRPVDIATLLDAGQAMPSAEMIPAFAAARAGRLADAECARLMKRVAAECSLAHAGVSAAADEHGGPTLQVSLVLNFTPRTATGQLPDGDDMQFVRRTVAVVPLPDGVAGKVGADLTGAAYLDFVYADAEAACTEVRRVIGNCSVMQIEAAVVPRGEMRGVFSVAWMEPARQIAEDQPVKPAG